MFTMQIIFLVILHYFTDIALSMTISQNLWDRLGKVRKKINKILNKHQENGFHFDINEFEYPRTNTTIKEIHRQLWQEYYECLQEQYSEISSERTLFPTALIALEGMHVTMKCQICISPIEMHTTDDLEWYFINSTNSTFSKFMEQSDYILISPTDKRLTIYNVKLEQTGQYWCKIGGMLSKPYYLFINSNTEAVKTVYPNTAPNATHATPNTIISEYNLKIYTTWTKWSSCSSCDTVGKKMRYGYCTIALKNNIAYRHTGKKIISPEYQDHSQGYRQDIEKKQIGGIENTTAKKAIDESIINQFKRTLHLFGNKFPCKGIYVPKLIQNIQEIKNRKTELMIGYCKRKCLKNVIFEVRDRQGNVLEAANNSAGIYSMVQGIPMISPPPVRTTIYQKLSKKAELICPGNINTDALIIWKMGNKVLNPSFIKEHSGGRIYINPQMHIVFKSLRFSDANIYSCWQNDKITGVVKLNITGEIDLQLNHNIVMIGGILIITVFLIVFWKIYQGHKRFTIH